MVPVDATRAVVTADPRTDLRVGPGTEYNRITVLPPGITLPAEGPEEDFYRVPLNPLLHGWVAQDQVRALDPSQPPPAVQPLRDISVQGTDQGTVATLNIPEPVPFRVRQRIQPPALILDLFGVRLARYGVRQFPSDLATSTIEAEQIADGWAQITFHLNFDQQRGWRVVQQDGSLRLLIRRPYEGGSLAGKVIVIDPGHGGPDSGAVGPTGVRESDVNLRVARELAAILQQRGAVPRMLRTGDTTVGEGPYSRRGELEARLAASEQPDADFFLSIHNNAVGSGRAATVQGTETYYWTPMSALPARILQDHQCAALGTHNRFISWRPFYVLRHGDMPRVLVECAFVSNPAEEQRMKSEEFARAAALGLADGLEEFFRRAAGER